METGRKHAVRGAGTSFADLLYHKRAFDRNLGTSAAVIIKCKQQQAPKIPALTCNCRQLRLRPAGGALRRWRPLLGSVWHADTGGPQKNAADVGAGRQSPGRRHDAAFHHPRRQGAGWVKFRERR